MFVQGLRALLATNAGLNAIVPANAIFPVLVPDRPALNPDGTDSPCLSYQTITAHSDYTIDGKEFREIHLQIDAWSTSYLVCRSIQSAVRNLLSGYRGTLTDGTVVLATQRENETDRWEDTSKQFRCICEYTFQIVEP